jgi:hypothetical protein
VSPDCNSFRDSVFKPIFRHIYSHVRLDLHCGIFCRDCEISAMDQFQKYRFVVPIEIVIVIAINLVVVVAGYYAIMMWGLFRS